MEIKELVKVILTTPEEVKAGLLNNLIVGGFVKPNGTPMTLKAFKEVADLHTYTGCNTNFKVVILRNSRDNIFAFKPQFNREATKAYMLKESYNLYKDIINNNLTNYESQYCVEWGNRGIPLSYPAGRFLSVT